MKTSWTLWPFLRIFACAMFLKVYFMEDWLNSLNWHSTKKKVLLVRKLGKQVNNFIYFKSFSEPLLC